MAKLKLVNQACWKLLLAIVCALGACRCDEKTPVPFKRGGQAGAGAAGASSPAPAAAQNGTSATYTDATLRVVIEGTTLARPDGSFRASLATDLDGDGARDALIVASDARGRVNLETALRKGGALTTGAAVTLVGDDETCSLTKAQLGTLGDAFADVMLVTTCTPTATATPTPAPAPLPNAPKAPPAPEAARPAIERVHHYVATLEATPRVAAHFATRSATKLTLALASEDRDADGHPDVRTDVDVPSTSGAKRVSLVWIDRPSGLARDNAEPEQTIGALATEANAALLKSPEQALALAEVALDLHARLCHESGRAELEIDETAGVACGASQAAGRAAVVRIVALTRKRALLPSIEAFATLGQSGYRLDDAQLKRAMHALASVPGDTTYVWQKGPSMRTPDSPAVRLPTVGFLDEDHLLLRGTIAQSYELATQTATPTAASGSLLVSDGAGGAAVVDIVRTCEGRRLRLANVAQGIEGNAGMLTAGAVGALVEQAASSEPVCDPKSAHADRAELSVLGQTAQGVLLAHGTSLLLAASPADPSSEARVLGADEAVPPLTAAGALSADGRRYVLATSEGIALIERGASAGVRLIRTPTSCSGKPSDAAISPSGARIAMLCGGQVYVADRPGAPTPTPATTTAIVPGPTEPAAPAPVAQAPAPIAPAPAAPSQPSPAVPVTALPPPAPEPSAPPVP